MLRIIGARWAAMFMAIGMVQSTLKEPQGSPHLLWDILSGSLCAAVLWYFADKWTSEIGRKPK